MKKILLSITAIALLAISAKAQIPNAGFENWSAIYPPLVTMEDPTGWASLNALTTLGGTQSVFKETTSPAVGTISVQIKTVTVTGAAIPNPYRPRTNFDIAGVLTVGKIVPTPSPKLTYGVTMPSAFPRPSTLSFQSKYTPVGNDSAFVLAYLTKYNGTKRDTIATGKYATGVNTSIYSSNSLTMNYSSAFPNAMPDSMQIFISSSVYSHAGAQVGSAFWIDDLAWSGYVGINDIAGNKNSVSVFPNPTNGQVTFNATVNVNMIEITDITGRLIGSYKTMDNHLALQTAGFVPGVYFYAVLNDKKEVVNRGKFEVTK